MSLISISFSKYEMSFHELDTVVITNKFFEEYLKKSFNFLVNSVIFINLQKCYNGRNRNNQKYSNCKRVA